MKKIVYILLFITFLVVVRLFFAAIYTVNQNSMNNTYHNGEKVLLIKNFYKIRHNDILIFNHDNEHLIKRCIGLPGDSIKSINGKIFVNNNEIENPPEAILKNCYKNDVFIQKVIYDSYGSNWNPLNFNYYIIPKKGTKINLSTKNKSLYENLINLDNDNVLIQNQSFYVFKNDYYYLIGDNRSVSVDSPFSGPVKSSNIATTVIFPIK